QWRWAVTASARSGDETGEVQFLIEATNVSDVEARSWHSDGYFFDVRASLSVSRAVALPFELEAAPRNFRYDRRLWGRGFNCAVVARTLDTGEQVFETTNVPIYAQPRFRANSEPPTPFDGLSRDPARVLTKVLEAMKEYDACWHAE